MSAHVEPSTAFLAIRAAYDEAFDLGLRGYLPAAVRAASDDAWLAAQLERRRRYLAGIATRLGLDPDHAAEILRGPNS